MSGGSWTVSGKSSIEVRRKAETALSQLAAALQKIPVIQSEAGKHGRSRRISNISGFSRGAVRPAMNVFGIRLSYAIIAWRFPFRFGIGIFRRSMNQDFFVYILSDNGRKTLYIGVTNDLVTRLWQHRNPEKSSFSQRYHCIALVHYEQFPDPNSAIAREKQLKGWRREKKNALIESMNPRWEELSAGWF